MNTEKEAERRTTPANELILAANNTPVLGMGATILLWTDRATYYVEKISEDGKKVYLSRAIAIRVDNNGECDEQEYRYEKDPSAQLEEVRFIQGCWKKKEADGKWRKSYIYWGVMREFYDYYF